MAEEDREFAELRGLEHGVLGVDLLVGSGSQLSTAT